MSRVVVIILSIFCIWMIWWAIGQVGYQKGVELWIDDRRNEGWVAEVGELETVGFPSRFDTTLTDVNIADPTTGVAWTAPFVQFLSLAYKPYQVIAVLPDTHTFSAPLQTMTIGQDSARETRFQRPPNSASLQTINIAHDQARASLFLKPSTSLGLDRARLVIDDLVLKSNLGWEATLREARYAAEDISEAAGLDNTYRFGVEILDLSPPQDVRNLLDPNGIFPDAVGSLRLDATLGFDAPWDRFALEDARPQVRRLQLDNLSARWGGVTFRASGEVDVDEQGIPDGRITIKAVEWRQMLDMAVNAGVLPQELLNSAESGLALMAALSGDPDTLDIPLGFSGGRMSLGPIPIGPAPRIVIR